ncbi:uncharacterized protein LOC132749198 [Ruditapes philippinarum]|uniref:uncharacterized protein LOC132749198 n=1 Tax=Ruditapes philippinarum TaxID=129788 RepID=UPI00295B3856|nr:uncharacterized protein LOC132749198 [Ruditapes philippinarum]
MVYSINKYKSQYYLLKSFRLNFFYIGTYRAEKNIKFGQICLLLFFLKNVYGGGGGGGGATAPPPPPLDFTMLLAAARQNQGHLTNIINGIQQTIAQQVAAISDIANTIADDASGINKRVILEKVNDLGSTFTDTNTKSSLIQSSVNHMNENIDSILQVAQSVNDITDTVKGTTNQIEQSMASIGSSFDHIAERISSTSHTTNEIKTQTDSIQSLASETNRKTDMLRSLFDNFARITRQTVQTARCLFG